MHYKNAIDAIDSLTTPQTGVYDVDFVSPIVSTTIAALCSNTQLLDPKRIKFIGNAEKYAQSIGLISVLNSQYQFPSPGGKQGLTYTKLTRLHSHQEVDLCNQVVNDLIFEQFGANHPEAHELAKVVGELHDNVASHANGQGYSCAQSYQHGNEIRIEFAVADLGKGMLRNVQSVDSTINSDDAAIRWCLNKGNTTARPRNDSWAQRLPEDAITSPFPGPVTTYHEENHHLGEGLWKLLQLVQQFNGRLWVCSGDGQFLFDNNRPAFSRGRIRWAGVAIEVELIVGSKPQPSSVQQTEIEKLAQRIGL